MIVKRGSQHCVVSKKGKNLGCSPSRAGAVKRLRQVEYFKHMKEHRVLSFMEYLKEMP